MGTGIFKWLLELAAEIAIKELLKRRFEETFMCVTDKATKLVYQSALDRFITAKKSPSRGHNLVEAAGFEPASASPLPAALHA